MQPSPRNQSRSGPSAILRTGCALPCLIFILAGAALFQDQSPRKLPQKQELRVTRVNDGDTVTCTGPDHERIQVRLKNIDAPELAQPAGPDAKTALQQKLSRGAIHVEGGELDQYGRLLGTLWISDRNINLEMVEDGWAWAYCGKHPDRQILQAEDSARRKKRGLWADALPERPSQWRKAHPRSD